MVKLEFELRSDFKAQAFGHYSSGSQPLLYIKIDGDFFFVLIFVLSNTAHDGIKMSGIETSFSMF